MFNKKPARSFQTIERIPLVGTAIFLLKHNEKLHFRNFVNFAFLCHIFLLHPTA